MVGKNVWTLRFVGWAAGLLLGSLLSACGGGASETVAANSKQSPVDPAAATQVANYGTPQDAASVAKTVERLNLFFSEQRAAQQALSESAQGTSSTTASPTAVKSGVSPKVAPLSTQMPTHRFFNTRTGVHFYTASAEERDSIASQFPYFQQEGAAFYTHSAPANGLHAVYRFYNRVTGTHFYTVSNAERDAVLARLADVFTLEGVAWYARTEPAAGWQALYRFFNKRTGTHFYTASFEEQQSLLGNAEYSFEGKGYYVKGEPTSAPTDWQPPDGATPAIGNYAYFQSEDGDWVGQGRTYLYTPKDALFLVNSINGVLQMRVEGYEPWSAFLSVATKVTDWKVGLYTDVSRTSLFEGRDRVLDVDSQGRGCNNTSGWIALDQVAHDAQGELASFELRFEQQCELGRTALRGKIRWSKSDLLQPDGPVNPIPPTLWQPDVALIAVNGNMVYSESNVAWAGGAISPTQLKAIYTPDNTSSFSFTSRVTEPSTYGSNFFAGRAAAFGVSVSGLDGGVVWGDISAMSSIPRLQVGYYGNVALREFPNMALGAIRWTHVLGGIGDTTCWGNTKGWFAIDDVAYLGDELTRISARFEQTCHHWDGSDRTVRGQVRWAAP